MMLIGGYEVADLSGDRTALDAAIGNVQNLLNTLTTSRGDRDIKRAAMRDRLNQFNNSVRGQLPGSRYLPSLQRLPSFASGPGRWRDIMDDYINLWGSINSNVPSVPGFTPPLLMSGGYTVALFTTDCGALDAAFTAVTTNEQNAQQARLQRNEVFEPIYQRLLQYRQAVIGALPPGHPLLDSIPRVTPAAGSTPAAANLSGVWNAGTAMGDLTWTHPEPGELDHFEIRYHPGPTYKASEEQVVDSVPNNVFAFSTNFGLVASGSRALFKVYAVTPESNERGSNTVSIVRP